MINEAEFRRRVKRWISPLARTPLHPQWLLSLRNGDRHKWAASHVFGRVLDIGCADARARDFLVDSSQYVGIDFPSTASGMYRTLPDIFSDGAQLPFRDESFDAVLMLDVAEHLPKPEQAFSEAARVLRHGGILLITIPYAYPIHDAPYDFQRLTGFALSGRLTDSGFSEVKVSEVGAGFDTACAALCLVLAQWSAKAIVGRAIGVLLIPLALFLVPIINVFGWVGSAIFKVQSFLPMGYQVKAVR